MLQLIWALAFRSAQIPPGAVRQARSEECVNPRSGQGSRACGEDDLSQRAAEAIFIYHCHGSLESDIMMAEASNRRTGDGMECVPLRVFGLRARAI